MEELQEQVFIVPPLVTSLVLLAFLQGHEFLLLQTQREGGGREHALSQLLHDSE